MSTAEFEDVMDLDIEGVEASTVHPVGPTEMEARDVSVWVRAAQGIRRCQYRLPEEDRDCSHRAIRLR